MEYYSAIKKNEVMPFAATQVDLEIIIQSEVSQKEKNKYHMLTHIYGIQIHFNLYILKIANKGAWLLYRFQKRASVLFSSSHQKVESISPP